MINVGAILGHFAFLAFTGALLQQPRKMVADLGNVAFRHFGFAQNGASPV